MWKKREKISSSDILLIIFIENYKHMTTNWMFFFLNRNMETIYSWENTNLISWRNERTPNRRNDAASIFFSFHFTFFSLISFLYGMFELLLFFYNILFPLFSAFWIVLSGEIFGERFPTFDGFNSNFDEPRGTHIFLSETLNFEIFLTFLKIVFLWSVQRTHASTIFPLKYRQDCFGSDYFQSCVEALLLTDEYPVLERLRLEIGRK